MDNNQILDAIGAIDDEVIFAAKKQKKGNRNRWVRWGAVAACLCLAVAGVLFWQLAGLPDNDEPGITLGENGVTIPLKNVSLSAEDKTNLPAFFIYQGRYYVEYERLGENADIVGERLGTATGLIDDWTPRDGYIEFAGSVKGDFYAVKGYDPSFMLCRKYDSGEVATYICNAGITLKYGSELYGNRLYLADNYQTVCYESRASWFACKDELYTLNDREHPVVAAFIDGLYKAAFIPWAMAVEREGKTASAIYDTELYHIYFNMENGLTVHLRLYENGYVRYQGLLDICVQIPQESFNPLIELLDSREMATAVKQ